MKTAAITALQKFDDLPTSKVVLVLAVVLLLGDKGLTSLDRLTGVDRILERIDAAETNIVAHVDATYEEPK